MMMAGLVLLCAGGLFALLQARQRRWIEAGLVLLAALSLAALLSDWPRRTLTDAPLTLITQGAPAGSLTQGAVLDVRSHTASFPLQQAVQRATSITLQGDGLTAAQWRDLPARPLRRQSSASEVLWLDFPRQLALGRPFVLSVRRPQAQANWRLQLVAENDQLLAEVTSATPVATLKLEWLPPLAERLLLRARVLDSAGRVLAQGPLPVQVENSPPLQIQARFDAASFDVQALNQLLSNSGAQLDWQLTLGKALTRQEMPAKTLDRPKLILVDAAYLEHLTAPARASLMAQVAQGLPLMILAANASQPAFWRREFGLALQEQPDAQRSFRVGGTSLILNTTTWTPTKASDTLWSVTATATANATATATTTTKARQPWLWQRDWNKGRIIWLGVTDWHRYAITAPAALGQWWQDTLDQAGLQDLQAMQWQFPDPFVLPGERAQVCARGAERGTPLRIGDQSLTWQVRAEQADAECAAFWPAKSGWVSLQSNAGGHSQSAEMYVYASSDWPAWQQALRQDATAEYAARLPEQNKAVKAVAEKILPDWLCALLFVLSMLGLWWRERR